MYFRWKVFIQGIDTLWYAVQIEYSSLEVDSKCGTANALAVEMSYQ